MKLKILNTGQSSVGWHRHGTVLLCPQKYAYSYVLAKKRSTAKPAPFLGTLVHLGLAHLYLWMGLVQRGKRAPYVRWREAIETHAVASEEGKLFSPPQQIELAAKALAIVDKYSQTYAESDTKQLEILKVEHEIRTQIDGELYTQRADLIVRSVRDDKVFIWDHKTAGGFGLSYGAAQYTLSGQILGLDYLGAELYGSNFGGVLLNMIGTKRPGDFERVYAAAAPDSRARWIESLRHARKMIKHFEKKNLDVMQYPRVLDPTVCYAYGGCDYYDACRWGAIE